MALIWSEVGRFLYDILHYSAVKHFTSGLGRCRPNDFISRGDRNCLGTGKVVIITLNSSACGAKEIDDTLDKRQSC
ncbi:Hypothetical protein NTJ_02447 [Nesidiocoris tenuis]|uniref:Uncharacterized protein n=1 Tax=Nesidiocoris tenuis TaxID=355587 RepID=A0ABN7AFL6_9HEMI|nr:Hypothetical protein NTJ_02447 [Nesidiocoris tenuis]